MGWLGKVRGSCWGREEACETASDRWGNNLREGGDEEVSLILSFGVSTEISLCLFSWNGSELFLQIKVEFFMKYSFDSVIRLETYLIMVSFALWVDFCFDAAK